MSKHSPEILFRTSCPSAFGNARRIIATALADRHQRAYFGGLNTTHSVSGTHQTESERG